MADKNPDVEEWKSLVKGLRGILRYDEKGEKHVERVETGATFFITPEERRRNEQVIRDQRDNDFTNGSFKMIAPAEDDPNSKSVMKQFTRKPVEETELDALLNGSLRGFATKINAISESVTMGRLYQLAREQEIGGEKFEIIKARLKELDPHAVVVGDKLGTNRENPDDQRSGPAANIDLEIESAPGPRSYASAET